jgi:glycolate dehydrogenase iron-sulfur subunit
MQTRLSKNLLSTEQGREADAILRRCVHCGFCNATCPTYQLLGDELDGPRGRIYLIKELLEEQGDVATVGRHLDRCLTCRNCETTCPSGVQYSRLLDIGREHVEQQLQRPLMQRLLRWGLRQVLPYPRRFAAGVAIGRYFKPLLPAVLRKSIPPKAPQLGAWPALRHARRVIILQGCVQSVAAPEINLAAARVLDHLGISTLRIAAGVCCGAVHQHMAAADDAAALMRINIDAWWPQLEAQQGESGHVEAIISTASACGVQLKDYGYYLKDDGLYREKAARISALAKDIVEIVAQEPVLKKVTTGLRLAFHAPCTLQHGQRLSGMVEGLLRAWGIELSIVKDAHLCCGSAGIYSILQPDLSAQLRKNKLAALKAGSPQLITSANIGCLMHLQQNDEGEGQLAVKHWVEVLADCLAAE